MALSGIVYGGSGLDRHFGLLQRGGADDVSIVDASAGALHVPAGAAGRHGYRQRGVGRVSIQRGSSGRTGLVVVGNGAGIGQCLAASADRRGIEDGSGSGKGLRWSG